MPFRVRAAMNRFAHPSLLVLVVFILSACAASGGPGGSGGSGGSTESPGGGGSSGTEDSEDGDGIAHPGGDELVLSVGYEGGFIPVEMAVAQVPSFVLLGDGRVITQGATTLEFPGPLLPLLQARQLTEDGVQQVLDGVIETGLFDTDLDLRGAANMIADASDTVFTLHAGDRQVTVTVYGLGTLLPDMPTQGIEPAEVEAHQTLQRLSEQLLAIDQVLPADAFTDTGWQPHEADAYRLYIRDATADPEGELPGQVREWPTDEDPATIGEEVELFGNGTRCVVADGAEWGEELMAANQNTRWTTDGETLYAITARPLFPYEERTCPELDPAA
jgi:hypothetical protein